MDELKTLEDLKLDLNFSKFPLTLKSHIESKLKQEAIKWIKEFQTERTNAISEMFDNPDKYGIFPTTKFFNRIDNFWIKKFNITEEDLQ